MPATIRLCVVSALALAAGLGLPAMAQEATTEAPAETTTTTSAAQALTAETVVATVGDQSITLGHMIALRDALPPEYLTLDDKTLYDGILNQLVQQSALAQTLTGKTTLRQDLTIQNETRGFLSGAALQVVAETAVTDAAIQAAYDERVKAMGTQTEYHAAHIIVDSEEKAAALKAEIDGGKDFAEVAKANSTDGAAANGGDLGWFGLGMMVKPFEDAVVAMKAGEVKGPLQTEFGWHLVKLIETRVAEAPKIDDLREELAGEIEKKAVDAHIEAVMAGVTVTKPGEAFDPAALKDTTILGQ
jgi:peptidyl-prolyl cis-trans isomerase C